MKLRLEDTVTLLGDIKSELLHQTGQHNTVKPS